MYTDSVMRSTGYSLTNVQQGQYRAGARSQLEEAVPLFLDTVKQSHFPSGSLTIMQPLYTGGRLSAAYKVAKADREMASMEELRSENEVAVDVWQTYYGMVLIEQTLIVRKEVLAGMEHHAADAGRLVAVGMIAKNSELRARAAVAEARRALVDDSCKLVLAGLSLSRLLNLDENETIKTIDSMPPLNSSFDENTIAAEADTMQPLLGMVRSRIDVAKAGLSASRGALKPRVVAFGKAELFSNYLSVLDPKWTAGVVASFEISGGREIAKSLAVEHQYKEAELALAAARRDVTLWVHKAAIEAGSAHVRADKITADIDLSNENLRECRSRFTNGYGTSLEVIDAELLCAKNRIERLSAVYDYHRSVMNLYAAAGRARELCER